MTPDLTKEVLTATAETILSRRYYIKEPEQKIPAIILEQERIYFSQNEFVEQLRILLKRFKDEKSDISNSSIRTATKYAINDASAFLSEENINNCNFNRESLVDYFQKIQIPESILGLSKDTYITIVIAIIIYLIQHRQAKINEDKVNNKLTEISAELSEIKNIISNESFNTVPLSSNQTR